MPRVPCKLSSKSSLNPHSLDIRELPNAVNTQFSAVPGGFDATKRNSRVRGDHLVDENHSGFEFINEPFALLVILCPCACTQAEAAVVRNPDRIIKIIHSKDRSHRSEELFLVGGRIL